MFGGFAVAVTPISGLKGIFGKWLQAMSGLMLLRLFFPPVSRVVIGLMGQFVSRPIGSNGQPISGNDVAMALFSAEHLVLAGALLWATGKVVSFLGEGVVAGVGTISGMLSSPGTVYSGVASTARVPASATRIAMATSDLTYKGASRTMRKVTEMAGRFK
jgi:hypothetical protein